MQDLFSQLSAQLTALFGSYVPNLVGAIAILVVGWIIALVAAAMVRGAVHRTTLDAKLGRWVHPGKTTGPEDVLKWSGRLVFYLIMLFVLLAVFQTLQLTQVTEPINRLLTQVFEFAPRLLSALILLGIAWVLAAVLRLLVVKGLNAVQLDSRLGSQANLPAEGGMPLASSIGDVVYWFVFLLFLPAILGALALEGLLAPVNSMMNTLLGFLPNLFAAALILLLGWLLARALQRIVTGLLTAAGLDRISERVGLSQVLGMQTLSGAVGLVVYVLILIPVLIGALNALALQAITQPASEMLGLILAALPKIIGASLVVIVAYMVGRVLATVTTNLLTGVGFNTILARIGLTPETSAGGQTPASIVGTLLLVAVMLFASMEAANLLGFQLLGDLIAEFTFFAGHLIFGLVIFAIGLYLANLASQAIRTSQAQQAGVVARAAYLAIVVLAGAMALRQMGLADEIVGLAFGLTLGAIAIAFALALGLGGREIAAQELKKWVESMKSKSGN